MLRSLSWWGIIELQTLSTRPLAPAYSPIAGIPQIILPA